MEVVIPKDEEITGVLENEKQDDFSLEKVPRNERSMSWPSITNITLGISNSNAFHTNGKLNGREFWRNECFISCNLCNDCRRNDRRCH